MTELTFIELTFPTSVLRESGLEDGAKIGDTYVLEISKLEVVDNMGVQYLKVGFNLKRFNVYGTSRVKEVPE